MRVAVACWQWSVVVDACWIICVGSILNSIWKSLADWGFGSNRDCYAPPFICRLIVGPPTNVRGRREKVRLRRRAEIRQPVLLRPSPSVFRGLGGLRWLLAQTSEYGQSHNCCGFSKNECCWYSYGRLWWSSFDTRTTDEPVSNALSPRLWKSEPRNER